MSIVDSLTLEKATEALDRIKGKFETENGKLAIITPDLYDQAFDILVNHFFPDAPLSKAFGVTWSKVLEKAVLEDLKTNISICMISKDTEEIMGITVSGIIRKTDPPLDSSNIECERLKSLLTFMTHKDDEINFFECYNVDEAVHFFTLGVKRKYRRMGLGDRLLAAAVAMSRELGFKAVKSEATSIYSQRIFEKQGFDIVLTMPYDSYYYNGRPLIDLTGEHTMTKIYGLRI